MNFWNYSRKYSVMGRASRVWGSKEGVLVFGKKRGGKDGQGVGLTVDSGLWEGGR